MRTDPGFALAFAVLVACVYLVVLRLVDLNEKEPLWALGIALLLGFLAAAVWWVAIDSEVRTLELWGRAITSEVAIFVAIGVTIAALEGIGRLRGWSEVNGLVDGMIYGAAVGLGFATGEAFLREASLASAAADVLGLGEGSLLWTTLLAGLAYGVFGAIVGGGFGLGMVARSAVALAIAPLAALVVAVLVHAGWDAFSHGGDVDGGGSLVRAWIGLLVPLALVAAAIAYGLGREGTAIADELADEAAGGTVTAEDLRLLRNPAARRAVYFQRLRRGDLAGWLDLRSVHNRQVQLALVERRLRTARDDEHREELVGEAARLRRAIIRGKREAGLLGTAPAAGPGG